MVDKVGGEDMEIVIEIENIRIVGSQVILDENTLERNSQKSLGKWRYLVVSYLPTRLILCVELERSRDQICKYKIILYGRGLLK
jgi:hypothetical protein